MFTTISGLGIIKLNYYEVSAKVVIFINRLTQKYLPTDN